MTTPDVFAVGIESDEDGFTLALIIDDEFTHDGGTLVLNVQAVAEELYDAVKREIGPWLQERDQARASMPDNYVEDPADVEPLKRAVQPDWDAVRDRERGK